MTKEEVIKRIMESILDGVNITDVTVSWCEENRAVSYVIHP